MPHELDYNAQIDGIDASAPCECEDCGWKGTFAALAPIEDAILTPGDPSPAGRCPECDTLAYIARPDAEAQAAMLHEALDLASSLQKMLDLFMQYPSEPERYEKAQALRCARRLNRLNSQYLATLK